MPRRASSIPAAAPRAFGSLPKATVRLLGALAEPGIVALRDPLDDDFVLLRGRRDGISVGRGRHAKAALDDLLSRGLAETAADGRGHVASAAGRSRLARERAAGEGPAEEAFGRQHRELDAATLAGPHGEDAVAVNLRESPLVWLRRRRGPDGEPLIDAAAFEAGERLRRDLTFAGLLPSVTARWDGAIGGGGGAPRDPAGATDTVIAARQRARAALEAVGGDFADLLLDLCGFLKGVEAIERDRGWPPRSGKVVVRLALAQLARHYGLSSEARGRATSRGVLTWFAAEEAA